MKGVWEKMYNEALERARKLKEMYPQDAPGYEEVFPELRESEDERIRKEIRDFLIDMECRSEWIAYMEKRKEQKPEERFEEAREKYQVEWSEEEKMDIELLIALLRGKVNLVEILDSRKESIITFLKSLRPFLEPSKVCYGAKGDPDPAGVWKPSEEQMEALLNAEKYLNAGLQYGSAKRIAELFEQLKKL